MVKKKFTHTKTLIRIRTETHTHTGQIIHIYTVLTDSTKVVMN